jgi:hypothetical protein
VYSIIRTIEALEGCYNKGLVVGVDYKSRCSALLDQYKNSINAFNEASPFQGLDAFCAEWELQDCVAAIKRVKEGKCAEAKGDTSTVVMVSDITGMFITIADLIELGNLTIDNICPSLKELILKLGELGVNIDNYSSLQNFQKKLEGMKSTESITQSEAMELKNMLNLANVSFKSWISKLK